jgi:hypothetical protein
MHQANSLKVEGTPGHLATHCEFSSPLYAMQGVIYYQPIIEKTWIHTK